MEGIEMLNDMKSPRSKKKKKSSSGSVSSRKSTSTRGSRKSLKSSKSKTSKTSKRKAKRGSSKDKISSSLQIDDNVSVMSDDSLSSLLEETEDDMSLQSMKSAKSASSKKSHSRRAQSMRASRTIDRKIKGPKRKSVSPKRSNSLGQLASKKESKRRDKTKRSNSLSDMKAKKDAKRAESKSSRRGSIGSKSGSRSKRRERTGSADKSPHSRSNRRGSMGSMSGSRSKHGRSMSSDSRFSTDDDSALVNEAIDKIDENGEYTKDLELSESQKKKSSKKQIRHNSSNTESTASSTNSGFDSGAIPTQVEIGNSDSKPSPAKESMDDQSFDDIDMDEELPTDEADLVRYMEERSKKLDANKDANLALTKDADERVDLQKERDEILAGANGPEYVEEVYLTCNGQKYEKVPVNSLQWYMFRYGELLNDPLDVYEEPRSDEEQLTAKEPPLAPDEEPLAQHDF